MTGISYWEFAVSIYEAGAIPSISTYCYYQKKKLNFIRFESAIKNFIKFTKSNNFIVAAELHHLLDNNFVDIICNNNVGFLEFFPIDQQNNIITNLEIKNIKNTLVALNKKTDVKILYRGNANYLNDLTTPLFEGKLVHGLTITGSDSAGQGSIITTKRLFELLKISTIIDKNLALIPAGGIGTPQQVQEYLELGADAVAVGTLFAACKESVLNDAVKQKMISATKQDLSRFSDSKQQALMLGLMLGSEIKNDTKNHSISLNAGIKGDGEIGHIFAGHGIDNITKIRTARETVEYLMRK
jgi:hypothetical protein